MFNKRSEFIYTALSYIQGYSIRRSNWVELMENNDEIEMAIRNNASANYFRNIKTRVGSYKRKSMDIINKRNDH